MFPSIKQFWYLLRHLAYYPSPISLSPPSLGTLFQLMSLVVHILVNLNRLHSVQPIDWLVLIMQEPSRIKLRTPICLKIFPFLPIKKNSRIWRIQQRVFYSDVSMVSLYLIHNSSHSCAFMGDIKSIEYLSLVMYGLTCKETKWTKIPEGQRKYFVYKTATFQVFDPQL